MTHIELGLQAVMFTLLVVITIFSFKDIHDMGPADHWLMRFACLFKFVSSVALVLQVASGLNLSWPVNLFIIAVGLKCLAPRIIRYLNTSHPEPIPHHRKAR